MSKYSLQKQIGWQIFKVNVSTTNNFKQTKEVLCRPKTEKKPSILEQM